MNATFNDNPCTIIVSCCRSTDARDETDCISFYNNLPLSDKRNVLIIGRDMNAQIGKERNNKFCLNN